LRGAEKVRRRTKKIAISLKEEHGKGDRAAPKPNAVARLTSSHQLQVGPAAMHARTGKPTSMPVTQRLTEELDLRESGMKFRRMLHPDRCWISGVHAEVSKNMDAQAA